MSLLLVSVMDSKVGSFANPFIVRSRGEAIRSFQDACGDDNFPFKKHPGDYVLHLVGSWDEVQGRIAGLPVPERLIGGDEF